MMEPWCGRRYSGTPGSANAPNAGKIDCQSQRIEANRQGQDIDFDAFLRTNQQPQHARERQLDACPMRAACERPSWSHVILADGICRHSQAEFGQVPGQIGCEGVTIGARPDTIASV